MRTGRSCGRAERVQPVAHARHSPVHWTDFNAPPSLVQLLLIESITTKVYLQVLELCRAIRVIRVIRVIRAIRVIRRYTREFGATLELATEKTVDNDTFSFFFRKLPGMHTLIQITLLRVRKIWRPTLVMTHIHTCMHLPAFSHRCQCAAARRRLHHRVVRVELVPSLR